jgi:hypothetical protein
MRIGPLSGLKEQIHGMSFRFSYLVPKMGFGGFFISKKAQVRRILLE